MVNKPTVWSDLFEGMMNEETPKEELRPWKLNWGVIDFIQEEEVAEALRKMKRKKAPGPDEVPVDVLK